MSTVLLEDVQRAYLKRRKAIMKKGTVVREKLCPELGYMELWVQTTSGVELQLKILGDGLLAICLRRVENPSRGRVLAWLDGLRVPAVGGRIVKCVEETMYLSWEIGRDPVDAQARLRRIWESVALDIVM